MSSEALRGVCVVCTGVCVCIQVNSNDSRTLYKHKVNTNIRNVYMLAIQCQGKKQSKCMQQKEND